MKKTVLLLIIVFLLVAIAIGCAALYFFNSPHYAMLRISRDVKANGLEGLEPHLTGNAANLIAKVTSLADNPLAGTILSLFVQNESLNVLNEYLDILKSELENVSWEIVDVMTGRKHAQVMLSFDYQGKVTGTINISMIRTDDGWKIDGVNSPKIDGFSLDDISLPDFTKFRFGGSDATDSEGTRFGDIELPDLENFNFEDITIPDIENFSFKDIKLPKIGNISW